MPMSSIFPLVTQTFRSAEAKLILLDAEEPVLLEAEVLALLDAGEPVLPDAEDLVLLNPGEPVMHNARPQ